LKGLVTDNDKTAYREEVRVMALWCKCSASVRKALQRVVHTAQYITGANLPAIQDLYTRRCQRKVPKMVIDCSLCYRTASGYWSAKSRSRGF
jgi:hypothetical protein